MTMVLINSTGAFYGGGFLALCTKLPPLSRLASVVTLQGGSELYLGSELGASLALWRSPLWQGSPLGGEPV